MRVGLTFFLREHQSIWQCGAVMQCVFLWMTLRRVPGVEVVAINAGHQRAKPDPALMLDGLELDFEPLSAALFDSLDVLIEMHGQVSAEHAARVAAHGGKVIAYKFGNAYVLDAERMIHGQPSGAIMNGTRFDEVWTNQQHLNTCGSYWEVLYRAPVHVLPHVWHPLFIEKARREMRPPLSFAYVPSDGPKRVSIFEPNSNIVKTCLIPVLACEVLYRDQPGTIAMVHVVNGEKFQGHVTAEHLFTSLDVWKAGKLSFTGRHNAPYWLSAHTDIVLAHQWENGLNYAYYDALYGGYPLVHNSPLLPADVGYRYDGFDIPSAARALAAAILTHDSEPGPRARAADKLLASVNATAHENVEIYASHLQRVAAA